MNSISRVIKDAFVGSTSRMVIVEQSVSNHNYSQRRLATNDILSDLLQTMHKTEFISFFVENRIEHNVELRKFMLFIIDGYDSFRYECLVPQLHKNQTRKNDISLHFRVLFNNFTSEKIEYNGQFLIVIPNSAANNDSTVSKILSDCWSLYITKVNILVPNESYDGIFLYTYYPFTAVYCEQAEPFVYNYFENDSFVAHKSHFPFKLANLHRCPLLVSTFDLPPHMNLIEFKNGSIYTDGIEGITLRVLSQRMNFTPIIVKGTRNILIANHSETVNETTTSPKDLRPTLNLVSSAKFV